MKKIVLSLLLTTSLSFSIKAQNVNIPDANFKAALVANTSINTNSDSEISNAEAAAYNGFINVGMLGITDLTGIEAFIGSIVLDCSNNSITTLDLSSNTGLYSNLTLSNNPLTNVTFPATSNITWLTCSNTPMTSIDISSLTTLTHAWIMNNYLSSIDISSNNSLIGMNITPSGANINPFTTIDFTGLTNLQWFYCESSFLTDLDISPCTSLNELSVTGSFNLASLNMANGNNMSFAPGNFDATNCTSLTCVIVDNVAFANAAWSSAVDSGVTFSLTCTGGTLATSMTIQGQGGVSTISTPSGTLQMEANILPAAASGQSVSWGIVSGQSLASIDVNGLLTALADGTVMVGALTSDGSNISATTDIVISNQSNGTTMLNLNDCSIYPNPASKMITIETPAKVQTVRIFDLYGNLVQTENSTLISVENLLPGVYIFIISTESGVIQRKFIRE